MLSLKRRLCEKLPAGIATCKFLLEVQSQVHKGVCQKRFFGLAASLDSKFMKVAVLGAANRIGKCLSLFLKQSNFIDELSIYDENVPIHGLALELSHIDTKCKMNKYIAGEGRLSKSLEDAKIVVIATRKEPGDQTADDDIMRCNANTVTDHILNIIQYCPRAMIAILTPPINVMVPLAAEIAKRAGIDNANRLFGVPTIHCVRANSFLAQVLGIKPECVIVPVIGGASGETAVPIYSQAQPRSDLTCEEIARLIAAVRAANGQVQNAYEDGLGYPSLAEAFAAARFCVSLCKGVRGFVFLLCAAKFADAEYFSALKDQGGVVECAYVRSRVLPELSYFTSPLQLGLEGVQKFVKLPLLTDQECKLLESAIPLVQRDISIGEELALGPPSKSSC